MNKNKGFTLVELLVVVAIMGILTVITVSQFQTARKKANDVARKGDLHALSKALNLYFADYNNFPIQINEGTKSDVWCQSDNDCTFADSGGYVYMKVLPKEKNRNLPSFCYIIDDAANPKAYALFAMLENTVDEQCHMDGGQGQYTCGGERYCFAYTSPNAVINETGDGVSL